MLIHLPIAQVAVDPLILIAIGTLVGFLSGLFGVGGGFLLTPLLIFYGIPAAVAVSTQANQILATSIAGVSAHWRERQVDTKLGTLMLLGGLAGSTVGVGIFSILKAFGVVDATISFLYIIFLGVIGGLMAWESVGALRTTGGDPGRRTRIRAWMRGLPMKRRFPRSGLYISIIPPIGIIVFVLHGLAPHIAIRDIYRGVAPFIVADLVLLAVLVAFPGLALWLPMLLKG